MPRYRTIKAELFSDGSLSECCRDARFLFVGLLPFVDDMGRRGYSAAQLKNEVFPGDTDINAQRVGYWLQQRQAHALLKRHTEVARARRHATKRRVEPVAPHVEVARVAAAGWQRARAEGHLRAVHSRTGPSSPWRVDRRALGAEVLLRDFEELRVERESRGAGRELRERAGVVDAHEGIAHGLARDVGHVRDGAVAWGDRHR